MNDRLKVETHIALEDTPVEQGVRALGTPSFYTCPECHGSMVAIQEGSIERFRCHTGHAYTGRALLQQALPKIEATLWSALAQAEERQSLLRDFAQHTPAPTDDVGYDQEARDMRQLTPRLREGRKEGAT